MLTATSYYLSYLLTTDYDVLRCQEFLLEFGVGDFQFFSFLIEFFTDCFLVVGCRWSERGFNLVHRLERVFVAVGSEDEGTAEAFFVSRRELLGVGV